MGTKTQIQGHDVWTIEAPDGLTSASFVPALGGIGSSLIMPGPDGPRELLFRHPFFWDRKTQETRGGWPFLFPVCGRLDLDGRNDSYRVDDTSYYLPLHGFAMRMPWASIATGRPDELVMELHDTDTTRARYPFNFDLSLRYLVEPGRLTCTMRVKNLSPRPMPYYAGFHPYLMTPEPGGGKEESALSFRASRRLRYNETLTRVVGERESPPSPLGLHDPALQDMMVQLGEDREVRLAFPEGYKIHLSTAGVETPDLFPYLQCYTLLDEPFFCAEPWMGYPNMLNEPDNVHLLPPGATEHAELHLWVSWEG